MTAGTAPRNIVDKLEQLYPVFSMMPVTRATDYAVRILIALLSTPRTRVKAADLAAATALSADYVLKIITPLMRRGWVRSFRGAGGGFSLVGQAQSIILLDVVELFEGPLHLQTCTGPEGCQFSTRCPVHRVWLEAEMELRKVLARYNIAELAAHSRRQGLFVARG